MCGHSTLEKALGEKFQIVTHPGPGVLRLQVAITDAEAATPGLRSVSLVVPQARVISTFGSLATGEQVFAGSLQAEAKLRDAATGQLLSAVVARVVGGGGVKAAAQWKGGDVRNAMDLFAKRMATNLYVPQVGPDTACIMPAPDRDVLVGVALSGGGSRAALFGGAGLEALGRLPAPGGGSVLEQVAYLSSVSGGSVAAAAYASQKPPREIPVLTPEGTLTAEYETFFAEYHEKLSQDFESALLWRQLLSFRWLNSSLAARSLAEVMAQRLLGLTTFAELAQREARGDSPQLIINTTLYNSGRRLVITTLPPDASRYDFYADLRAALGRRGQTAEFPPAFLQRWEKLLSLTPTELGIDPCSIRLAGAVAASASFPPLVGPITFHVGEADQYWHTGDGGLYENQGLESLLFVFLKQLQAKTARRALILVFDSSFPFAVGERRLTRRSQPFSLWNYDYTRIPSIMEQRASTYQALFLRSLQLDGVFPDDQTIRIVQLRHTDAQWQPDLSDLPAVCREENPALDSPTAVVEHIAEISTRFWLASACDRHLLQVAAAKVVAQHQQEIVEFLQGPAAGGAAR